MKKIKLFLAACAAMVGLSAQAQTAADFANGKYVFQNVGSGRYLGPGNSWGTQASLIQFSHFNTLAKLSDGVYSIESQVSNGGTNYYFTGSYMDGGVANVTINEVSAGVYTMSNGTTYYGYDGSSYVLASNLTDPTAANAQWKIMAYDDVYAGASETNPVDVTYMILCSNFDRNHRSASAWTMEASNKNLSGGTDENRCAESWRAAFTLSQEITVPNGYYKLQAQAALTEYTVTGANFPVVYATSGANTVSVPFLTMQNGENSMNAMSAQFTSGNYFTGYTDVITVTNGSLTVGVKGTRTDTWCIWDNFNLVYMGPVDLSAYAAELANAVAAAQATEGTIPAAAYSAIEDVITANNKTYSVEGDYTAAITAINNAVSTYASAQMVAAYAYTKKALALYNQANYSEKEDGAKAAFKAVLDAVETKATVDEVNTANAAIPAALASFMGKIEFENNGSFDITPFFLNNADFSAGNIEGWETNYVSGQQAQNIGYQGSSYTNGDVRISQFIEAWLPAASGNLGDGYLRQTVSGLPEGKYVLEADGIAVKQNNTSLSITGASLFIYADGVYFKTAMTSGDGKPEHFSTEFLNTGEGAVQFGLMTENATNNWLCADNFTVKFYGIDLSPYATLLAQAVAEANAIDQSTLTTAAAQALSTAVTENNKTWSTAKEYTNAIAAIQTATNAAKGIPAALAKYNTTKATVSSLKNVEGYTESVDGATTTFDAAISAVDTNVDAAATVDEVAAQEAALITAAKTFLGGVRSDGEHAFDITFLITNPNFDNNNVEGWTKTQGNPTTRMHCNEFYQTEFDFNQTLTDMPKGNYELKVQAFQRPGFAADIYPGYLAGTSKATSVIYINEGTTTINHFGAGVVANTFGYTLGKNGYTFIHQNGGEEDYMTGYDVVVLNNNGTTMYGPQMMETAEVWFDNNMYDNSVLTAVEGELKLGFKSTQTHVDGDWTIFDNFRLYYYGQSINVAMDEAVAFSALADIEGANVTMARKSKIGYNTVALPFDLTATQVQSVFGDGAVVYAFSENSQDPNNATVEFNSKSENTIDANVPVLVKATAEANQIVADNVTVKTGAAKVEGTNFDFVGNYGGQITLADGIWFVGNDALYKSAGATNMKGFRAYIEPKTATQNPVKLYIDGLETSISEINGEGVENGVIYNLAGQRVNKAQKGIYIQNGKKVLVK